MTTLIKIKLPTKHKDYFWMYFSLNKLYLYVPRLTLHVYLKNFKSKSKNIIRHTYLQKIKNKLNMRSHLSTSLS